MAKKKPSKKSDEKVSELKQALGLEKKPEQPAKKWPRPTGKLPVLFYDVSKKNYWLQMRNGRYLDLDKGDAEIHLIDEGLENPQEWIDGIKKVDRCFLSARKERCVDYAGPLAGYRTRIFETSGGLKILITRGFKFIEPKAGPLPCFERFITELLPGDQSLRFISWLKVARWNLNRECMSHNQALIIAGEQGCGKSFLQHLITVLLGGRACEPYQYMIGETQFNKDLTESEHWMIEDKFPQLGHGARRRFGNALKQAVANLTMKVHPKGRDGVSLPLNKWLTITLNSETENMAMVPPLEDSVKGKFSLFMCGKTTGLEADTQKNWKRFEPELPAIAHYVDSFNIPKPWRDSRFGVVAYHHPKLLEVISQISQETLLLEIIDSALDWPTDGSPWKGTASDLEAALRRTSYGGQAAAILPWSSACGSLLGKLKDSTNSRVTSTINHGKNKWTIQPPPPETKETKLEI